MISIVSYRHQWVAEFEQLSALIQEGLGELAIRIDHIGSTSVPGLAAKDIIDIQITVSGLSDQVKLALCGLGFQHREQITHDHIPVGHEQQHPDSWRKMFFREPESSRPINCHVRQLGLPNQRYPILFRDFLCANPQAASGYGEFKKAVVKYHPENEMNVYYELKDPVTDMIIGAAEQWAEMSGWTA